MPWVKVKRPSEGDRPILKTCRYEIDVRVFSDLYWVKNLRITTGLTFFFRKIVKICFGEIKISQKNPNIFFAAPSEVKTYIKRMLLNK